MIHKMITIKMIAWYGSCLNKLKSTGTVIQGIFNKREDMQVSEVMNRDAVWVNPDNRLEEALEIMTEFDLESIPIIDGFTICGTLSRHKLCMLIKSLGEGQPSPSSEVLEGATSLEYPKENNLDRQGELLSLKDAMDDYFTWCSPSDTIGDVAATMLAYHLHVLPVVEHDEFCGVVSRRDLLRWVAEEGSPAYHSGEWSEKFWDYHQMPAKDRPSTNSDPSSLLPVN